MPPTSTDNTSSSSAENSFDSHYKDVYNKEAASYDQTRFGNQRWRYAKQIKNDLIVELLRENYLLNPETKLLDVASGTGRIAHDLVSNGLHNVYAADISKEMLKKNKENLDPSLHLRMNWVLTNMKKLPFEDGFFDATTIGSFLYLIPLTEYANYVADIRRVLKPGGLLICEVSNTFGIFNPKNAAVVMSQKYIRRRKVKSYVTPWGLKSLFPGYAFQEIIGVEYPILSRDYKVCRKMTFSMGRSPILRYLGGKIVLVLRKQ
jgi:ubiquinone/menaquinone biosynthesis C-methylase UbiE